MLILDFDGTMTDAELEGAPFRGGYLDDVAALAGLPRDEVEALAQRFEAEIAANPGEHGWVFGGRIVAPATVDPYLRIMPVARLILDHAGRLMDETDRSRVLDAILYKYNYTKTRNAPREGAADTLRALAGEPVYVVTNSHTDAVQDKIREMGKGGASLDWLVERVYGRARKYMVDDALDAVPAELRLPGLDRPVLLRRAYYYGVLDALREEVGARWEDVVVVGDIFELDLALPLALGARVGLMTNAFTPPWECAYLERHARGRLLSAASEVPAFFAGD